MGVRWQLAALIASIATTSLLGGCVVVTSGTANAYETCNSGENCTGLTTCESANTTTDGFVGDFCTASCDPNSSNPGCPASLNGLQVCVPDASGLDGQCYAGCDTSADCPGGETCAMEGNGVSFCVP